MDPNTRKICAKRQDIRRELIEKEMLRVPHQSVDTVAKVAKSSSSSYKPVKDRKKPGRKKGWHKAVESSPGYKKPKGMSKGSIPMSIPDNLLPVFARLITANGTNARMDVINEFVQKHPECSARQATIKFTQLSTKERPSCVPAPPKYTGKGRTVMFYVRPRYYHMLPEEDRPFSWEEAAQADEVLWLEEQEIKKKAKAANDEKMRAMAAEMTGESDDEVSHNTMSEANTSPHMTSFASNDSDEESERPEKKQKTL